MNYDDFLKNDLETLNVLCFAKEQGISPGSVVGKRIEAPAPFFLCQIGIREVRYTDILMSQATNETYFCLCTILYLENLIHYLDFMNITIKRTSFELMDRVLGILFIKLFPGLWHTC